MKIKNLIILASFSILGSQVINSQSKAGSLPVFDISKNYPEKKILLQDIADIEYIRLETADDLLLSGNVRLSHISDKYILIHEPQRGDIYVFEHTGKLYAHFNHKGQSGMEYAWIASAGPILDEKNKEIFVCNQTIQVYSLNGEYKRTLKINTIQNESKVYNFDDQSLLVYDDVIIEPGFEDKTKKAPYRLMSKKDGSSISVLDIHLPKRYSNRIVQIEGKMWRPFIFSYPHNMHNGKDLIIADISSDTLYHLTSNKKLIPMLTRKPSVHASEPRNVWTNFVTTDNFMLIGMITLNPSWIKGRKIPTWMYNLKTGEINKVSISDAEFNGRELDLDITSSVTKSMTGKLFQASLIIDKKRILKGNIEKLEQTLNEDDNPIIRIIKFK